MRLVLVLAAFLFATPFSLACSCGGPNPICSAYWQTPVVFRGKVAEQVLVSSPETTVKNFDGSISTLRAGGFYRVRFSVFETFRGEPQKEIIILTNEQSSACGFPFETGGEYLVFGFTSQTSDALWTSKCTLTHKLEVGKEDPDLTWMRALPSAPAGAIIFGNLTLPRDDFETARPTATISLRGQVLRDATTDQGALFV